MSISSFQGDNTENYFGRHAGLQLYEEGLITFDMIDFVTSLHDHGTFIPYNLIGQFIDLTALPIILMTT